MIYSLTLLFTLQLYFPKEFSPCIALKTFSFKYPQRQALSPGKNNFKQYYITSDLKKNNQLSLEYISIDRNNVHILLSFCKKSQIIIFCTDASSSASLPLTSPKSGSVGSNAILPHSSLKGSLLHEAFVSTIDIRPQFLPRLSARLSAR